MKSDIADKIAAQIASVGRVIDPPATAAIYEQFHDKEPYSDVTVTRDVAYGPAERQTLDVFQSPGTTASKPVLVFVHGGGFTGGAKYTPGSPFYDNIPLWAARNGMVGVNITYPLAPQATWPSGAENVGAGMRWVAENITRFGGDPKKIVLMGHSAGATHVSTLMANPKFQGTTALPLAGVILASGIYDFATFPLTDNYRSYTGNDPATYAERSPITTIADFTTPIMVVYAELEPPPFITQHNALVNRLTEAGRAPRALMLPGHSHISLGYAIGTADTLLSNAIQSFVKDLT